MGFNCVRLPYSTQGYVENPVVADSDVLANPSLKGKRFLEILDITVQAITDQGLMVIMNNHNHRSGWCCNIAQDEGFWYTLDNDDYTESIWIESLTFFAGRYRNNSMVVAYDLRNEPHNYQKPDGTRVELTWGDGNPETDWAAASKRAGDAVLAVHPDAVIVVEALCFAMELRPLTEHQIELSVPNRLVYEVHNYMEFQLQGLVSARVVGWIEVRDITFTCLLILSGLLVAMGRIWWRLGKPRPPGSLLAVTFGIYMFFLSICGMLLAISFYNFFCEYCTQVAQRDILPWLIFTTVSTFSFLCLAIAGCVAPRCQRRSRKVASKPKKGKRTTLEMDGVSDAAERSQGEDGDADAALHDEEPAETSSPPVARPRGCCGAPGFKSCSMALRGFGHFRCDSEQGLPALVDWDWGLSIGLQFFVGFLICWMLVFLVFVWAHIFPSYWWLQRHFDSVWGFALEHGQPWTAPIWMGEFGALSPGNYWNDLLQYMSLRDIDWAYWPLNGLKYVDGEVVGAAQKWVPLDEPYWINDTFSILNADADSVRAPWRVLGLQAIMPSPARWNPGERACTRDSRWGDFGGSSCGG
jgi:hypothetical protein